MELIIKCKAHPDQDLSLYCEKEGCECFICQLCLANHQMHKVNHFSAVLPSFKENLNLAIKNYEDVIGQMNKLLENISNSYIELNKFDKSYDRDQVAFIKSIMKKLKRDCDERKLEKSKVFTMLSELARNANFRMGILNDNLMQCQDIIKELSEKAQVNSLIKLKDMIKIKDNLINRSKLTIDKFTEINEFVNNSKIICPFNFDKIELRKEKTENSKSELQENNEEVPDYEHRLYQRDEENYELSLKNEEFKLEIVDLYKKLTQRNEEISQQKETISELNKQIAVKSEEIAKLTKLKDETDKKEREIYDNIAFTSKHSVYAILNNGKTIKRIEEGKGDVAIYSTEGFNSGIHQFNVSINSKGSVGFGIHSNNVDINCTGEIFLFASGTSHGGLKGTYEKQDKISLILNFYDNTFTIKGSNFTSTVPITKKTYYFCAEMYKPGSEFTII